MKNVANMIKLKTAILLLFSGLFLFFACAENSNPIVIEKEKEKKETKDTLFWGNGTTTPYIKGTFVDFWKKSNWDSNKWDEQIKEMKEIGIKTLFVHFTAYNNDIWCNSENSYSTLKHPTALANLLDAAEKNNISVFIGLYFDSEYWDYASNQSVLNKHAQRSMKLADDIWKNLGSYKSFEGWYISHEPAPSYYKSNEQFSILKESLINPIANHCKSISNKPVAMTIFFNESVTSVARFSLFTQRIGTCNLDIIILQDGIGVNHCSINTLENYFAAANNSLYKDGNFEGAFWADIETFKEKVPESFDVVKQKLEITDSYVTRIVSFQYYDDMSPNGPNSFNAKKLRDNYLKYYKAAP